MVFWALSDARYPAVAVDEDGRPRAVERAKLAATTTTDEPSDLYGPLIGACGPAARTRMPRGSSANSTRRALLAP